MTATFAPVAAVFAVAFVTLAAQVKAEFFPAAGTAADDDGTDATGQANFFAAPALY
jgi:hypothetical protein